MSKYSPLWDYVAGQDGDALTMTFDEVKGVLGFEIDHSFLNFKKELTPMGWQVGKISLKGKTVDFTRLKLTG